VNPHPPQPEVIVIGAGPAGLAAAGALRQAGIGALVIDRAGELGSSWRAHYDRLHLHTVRRLSGLPGLPIPSREGPWVARDGVVRYLEDYAAHHRLEIRCGVAVTGVERVAGGWVVRHEGGALHAGHVIVATGYNHTPVLPAWTERFSGELIHASRYRNGRPYAGRDVLVVGAGNTGAEIAVDLAEHGAGRVRLAYRTPPHVLRRSTFGVPAQLTGVLMRHLPAALADALIEPVRRRTVPDLSAFGLPDPGPGAYARAKRGEVPILDVGLIDAVRSGRVTPVPAAVSAEGGRVLLAGGEAIEPDAVIVACGYQRGLEPLVGHLDVLGSDGRPAVHGPRTHPHARGLRFIGYTNPVSGMFREIAIDARKIARAIAGENRTEVVARDPRHTEVTA
jgi:NADPH-dependent 2,4-dienoyl-CoA reductase/sulfur reductase-like enzyme